MRLKHLLKPTIIALIVMVSLQSCDVDQEELTVTDTAELSSNMLLWDEIPNEIAISQSKSQSSPQIWHATEAGQSFFYRVGNKIYEENNGKIIYTFDVWNDTHTNAIYANDPTRHLNISLPITERLGGKGIGKWWSHSKGSWYYWKDFIYTEGAMECSTPSGYCIKVSGKPSSNPGSKHSLYNVSIFGISGASEYEWLISGDANSLSDRWVVLPRGEVYKNKRNEINVLAENKVYKGSTVNSFQIKVRGKYFNGIWSDWVEHSVYAIN